MCFDSSMEKIIQAIVLDGFHAGHFVSLPYSPTINLLKPRVIMVDTCCRGDEMPPLPEEIIEYKECFRSVDQTTVLYSTTGEAWQFRHLYPASFSKYPWTNNTTLYYGYHDGFLKRVDANRVT